MRLFLLVVVMCSTGWVAAQTAPAKYWIQFTDKDNTPHMLADPTTYLSPKAIDRRIKQGIAIEENDLPVDPVYVDSILNSGIVTLLHQSKWFNAVSIETTDTAALDTIATYSFVSQVRAMPVYGNAIEVDKFTGEIDQSRCYISNAHYWYYGNSYAQVAMLKGHVFHDMGLKGSGMTIAVLDAGFDEYLDMEAFSRLIAEGRVVLTKDFVDGDNEVRHHTHGSYVLSCMAAELSGELIGTAVEADYMLIRTEDHTSEYILEEDNWVAGAEYADSAGTDIINTSLGYNEFDDPLQNHAYADMDGNTTRIAIATDIAASKGILCVTSAGNSGSSPWYNITTPADADSCLAVGAVDLDGEYVEFSGKGPSADGDVKPNVTAAGSGMVVADVWNPGTISGDGTSFSSPLIAGMAASLWGAFPDATNMEVLHAIEQSADHYDNPDIYTGYGIPNFYKAYLILGGVNPDYFTHDELLGASYFISDYIELNLFSASDQDAVVEVFDFAGRICLTQPLELAKDDFCVARIDRGVSQLGVGNYVVRITTQSDVFTARLVKPY